MIEKKRKGRKRVGKAGRITGIAFLSLQVLALAAVFYELIKFPILPKRIMIELGIIFAIGLGVSVYALLIRKTRNSVIFGCIWAGLWIIGCVVGLLYLRPMIKTVKNVTGQEATETIHISGVAVLVRANDPAKKIPDTNGYKYGVQKAEEYANSVAAYEYIANTNKLSLTLTEYEYYGGLGKGLLSGEVDAIIADVAYVPMLEEFVEGFAGNYKILGELAFDKEIPRSTAVPTEIPNGNGEGPGQGGQNNPTDSPSPSGEPQHPTQEPVTPPEDNPTPTVTPTITPTPTPKGPTPTPTPTPLPMPERSSKDITEEYFTVYISGIDCYGAISARSRSDVNIVMTVNPKTKKILLVTIPRDAYVIIPGISGNSYDKLTHAGVYGVRASMNTLQNVYGIKIDYYIRVNFSSVERFVDLLGGVDVYSAYSFSAGGTGFNAGVNHLNGKRALIFSRERHAFAAGDHQRGKNQMEVIKGIIAKIQTPAILNNFSGIMETISGNVQTSITTEQLLALVRMQLDTGAEWSVETYAVSTTGGYEYCYTYKGEKLYVGYINWNTAREAANKMRAVMQGN